jgi:hypothetical protein
MNTYVGEQCTEAALPRPVVAAWLPRRPGTRLPTAERDGRTRNDPTGPNLPERLGRSAAIIDEPFLVPIRGRVRSSRTAVIMRFGRPARGRRHVIGQGGAAGRRGRPRPRAIHRVCDAAARPLGGDIAIPRCGVCVRAADRDPPGQHNPRAVDRGAAIAPVRLAVPVGRREIAAVGIVAEARAVPRRAQRPTRGRPSGRRGLVERIAVRLTRDAARGPTDTHERIAGLQRTGTRCPRQRAPLPLAARRVARQDAMTIEQRARRALRRAETAREPSGRSRDAGRRADRSPTVGALADAAEAGAAVIVPARPAPRGEPARPRPPAPVVRSRSARATHRQRRAGVGDQGFLPTGRRGDRQNERREPTTAREGHGHSIARGARSARAESGRNAIWDGRALPARIRVEVARLLASGDVTQRTAWRPLPLVRASVDHI